MSRTLVILFRVTSIVAIMLLLLIILPEFMDRSSDTVSDKLAEPIECVASMFRLNNSVPEQLPSTVEDLRKWIVQFTPTKAQPCPLLAREFCDMGEVLSNFRDGSGAFHTRLLLLRIEGRSTVLIYTASSSTDWGIESRGLNDARLLFGSELVDKLKEVRR